MIAVFRCSALALALAGLLAGCLPPVSDPAGEEREPFFRKGKELVNTTDFPAATEAFEKALEINPHNALAHYELGLLCERDDQAAAIFHFAKFIKLRPNAPQAERAKERLSACRQMLAQSAALSMTPNIQATQKELERLTVENRDLKIQIEAWKKWYGAQQRPGGAVPQIPPATTPANPPSPHTSAQATTPAVTPSTTAGTASNPTPAPEPVPLPPMPERRTHVVRQGETPAAIARKYGVSINALMEANPNLSPRRMRAGQSVTIPPK